MTELDDMQVVSVKQDPSGVSAQPATRQQSSSSSSSQQHDSQAVHKSQPVISEVDTTSNIQDNHSSSKGSGFRFPSSKLQFNSRRPQSQQNRTTDASNLLANVNGRHSDDSGSVSSSGRLDPFLTAVTDARNTKSGTSSSSKSAVDDSTMRAVASTRMQAVDLSSNPAPAREPGGSSSGVQPDYELVYRGQVDLGDAWEGFGRNIMPTKYLKV